MNTAYTHKCPVCKVISTTVKMHAEFCPVPSRTARKRRETMDYYESVLSELKPNIPYAMSIKIWDANGHVTPQLDLNTESLQTIIDFLQKELDSLKGTK